MDTSTGPGHGSKKPDDSGMRSSAVSSHSEAVQALRKYLLRKMSSEESSGDKGHESITEKVVSLSVAESDGSKLFCSLVQRPTDQIQGNRRCLSKHKSLDLDTSTQSSSGLRYLRTDLCIPVLWSKCSFCQDFFENDEQLRKHLRDSHFQYFLNYMQLRPLTTTQSLSDLPFSSALKISESLGEDDNESDQLVNMAGQKKTVKCDLCGKHFTTKWSWKEHLKYHVNDKEIEMETEPSLEPSLI